MPEDEPAKGDPDDPKPDTDWEAEAKKWKRHARKHEDQAKANAAKLKELEDGDKSDNQKLTDRITSAERKADEAEQRALRAEVALSKGLTVTQAKRLVGSTLDELEADADELLEDLKPAGGDKEETDTDSTDGADKGKGAKPPTRPTEDLKGGSEPGAEPTPDMRKVVDEVLADAI